MPVRTKMRCDEITEWADGSVDVALGPVAQESADSTAYTESVPQSRMVLHYDAGVSHPFVLAASYYVHTYERGTLGAYWRLAKTVEHEDGWGEATYTVVAGTGGSGRPSSGTFAYRYAHANAYGAIGRPGVAFDLYIAPVSDATNSILRGKPAPASPTVAGLTAIALTWPSVSGASSYEAEVEKSDGAGGWTAQNVGASASGTSKSLSLTAGTYRTRMRSRDAAGVGSWSAWSQFTVTTPLGVRFKYLTGGPTGGRWYVTITNTGASTMTNFVLRFTPIGVWTMNDGVMYVTGQQPMIYRVVNGNQINCPDTGTLPAPSVAPGGTMILDPYAATLPSSGWTVSNVTVNGAAVAVTLDPTSSVTPGAAP